MISYFFEHYKIYSSLIIFFTLYLTFISYKPSFCFDEDNNLLQFGLNYKNKTILPMWLVTILIAIISYFSIYYYLHLQTIIY